ncbi:UDP-glucuronosyl/UDP-glucosyltransferase, partial [Parasponia andersonii]
QGHVNSMLKLAELLALTGLYVTFLTPVTSTIVLTISNGHEEDHPRTGDQIVDGFFSMMEKTKPVSRERLVSGKLGSDDSPLVTCIISDAIFGGFTIDVAEELGVPVIHFRTASACYFWSYFSFPDLIESDELL